MCPKICCLSTCSLRLLSILAFGEFILLRLSIRREHHRFTENHISPPERWFTREQKAFHASPGPDRGHHLFSVSYPEKKANAFDLKCSSLLHPEHRDLVLVFFLSPSSSDFHCSPAKPLKTPQLCIQAQSRKLETMLHQVAPSHYTFRA